MKYQVVVAFLFSLTSSIANAQSFEYNYPIQCADTEKIIAALQDEKFAEKLSWTGRDFEDQSMYSLWINESRGTWTLLKMSIQKVSCILGVGNGSTLSLGEKT